jgi:hypothetical protein
MQQWQIVALGALGLAYGGWYLWTNYGFRLKNLVAGNKDEEWARAADDWITHVATCKSSNLEDQTKLTTELMGIKGRCQILHATEKVLEDNT